MTISLAYYGQRRPRFERSSLTLMAAKHLASIAGDPLRPASDQEYVK